MALFMANEEAGTAWENPGDDPDLLGIHSMMNEPPEETAEILKEQGNLAIKNGKKFYREALKYYTEAIECNSKIVENNSVYYSNRAHVNLLLENYGRAMKDCQDAIRLNPKNVKAHFRGAKAAIQLKSYDLAVEFCESGAKIDPENVDLIALLRKAKGKIKEENASAKKAEETIRKTQALVSAFAFRRLRFGRLLFREHTNGKTAWLDKSGILHFPVLLLYGEVMSSDLIEDFCETDLFVNHIDTIFGKDAPALPWDTNHKYQHDTVELYYQTNTVPAYSQNKVLAALLENQTGLQGQLEKMRIDLDDDSSATVDWSDAGRKNWVKVNRTANLGSVLSEEGHIIPGVPVFYVVAKGTPFRKLFLSGTWAPP